MLAGPNSRMYPEGQREKIYAWTSRLLTAPATRPMRALRADTSETGDERSRRLFQLAALYIFLLGFPERYRAWKPHGAPARSSCFPPKEDGSCSDRELNGPKLPYYGSQQSDRANNVFVCAQ